MSRPRSKAPKTLRSAEHRLLCELLTNARARAKLTQTDLAKRLDKPQSYVAKYEGGERRLDVIEFLTVCGALGTDALSIMRSIMRNGQR